MIITAAQKQKNLTETVYCSIVLILGNYWIFLTLNYLASLACKKLKTSPSREYKSIN